MGGGGSLSHNNFSYTDKNKILDALHKNKIKISGNITTRNLAVVSSIVQALEEINKKHGLSVDEVRIDRKNTSNALLIHGKSNKSGKTALIIPKNTLDRGFRGIKKDILTSHKKNGVVGKNIYESVLHEMGHEAQNRLKTKFPDTYKKLVSDLRALQTTKGAKHKVSEYAYKKSKDNKKTGKKGTMTDTISESLVHILQGSKSRGGSDSVSIVKRAFEGRSIINNIPNKKASIPRASKKLVMVDKKPTKNKKLTLQDHMDIAERVRRRLRGLK